jgi:hypothetical protein
MHIRLGWVDRHAGKLRRRLAKCRASSRGASSPQGEFNLSTNREIPDNPFKLPTGVYAPSSIMFTPQAIYSWLRFLG